MNQLVTTDWLNKNIEKVKILDASWHLPNANRNSFAEYKTEHITNSIFFDIFLVIFLSFAIVFNF